MIVSELYMRLNDAVKRVNLLCKWEFGKDCTFDETILRQELEQICQVPSPIEVVRCRECKYFSQTTLGMNYACWHGADTVWGETGEHAGHNVCQRLESDNGYCSYGVRKEQE